jgi:DNA topoisomerase-1
MSKILVIVESPGKIKKINEYLGNDYIVKASFGHVQDLDKKTLSIEVEKNFNPLYKVSDDKKKVVKELRELASSCKDVILASDEDREGEAIAGSLRTVLKLTDPKRIVFHEITKKAITDAIKNPRIINEDLVNAQQARRLLDRLMGYKISPILWKYKVGDSAGRVQSVVVRILVDKEKEIDDAISEPFLKTTGEFSIKDTKFNGTLNYEFKKIDDAKNFLQSLDKETTYKVVSVENKKTTRKPSAPFITSTLQQDASTKMGFAVKRTMDAAQKLYEMGLITYMRTDSTNLSEDALKSCEKYIKAEYGKEYHDMKTYSSKSKGAQEAHEAIRPTHIDSPNPDHVDGDYAKLYSLIWKRTVASQMSNAKINTQIISIDAEKNKKSLLKIKDKQYYFISSLENIEFDGFLKLYDNTSEDDETVKGKIEIKEKDVVEMHKLKVNEEYTKLPLRFNEAGLIKYLEKNGIGRPSTYASIISKIIDKKYVEIKNIDGIEKDSKCLELSNNKKMEVKESTKKVKVGKENKKLVPTDEGKKVVDFLLKNFEPVMEVKFTADFEEYLDKIAEGKAKWYNILNQFYQLFNPICEKLLKDVKENPTVSNEDTLLGIDDSTGLEIYIGAGKYGPYVKKLESEDSKKWKYAAIKDGDIELEDAIKLLKYPVDLGTFNKKAVYLYKGQFGLYVKYGDKNISLKDMNEDKIDFEKVKPLLEGGDKYALKTFTVKNKTIIIKNGQYGNYIQIVSGTKKENIPLPKHFEVEDLTLEDVLGLIADKKGTVSKPFKKKD